MAENGVRVEIISKQTIKPSSQTPPHLNKLNLSYLDQLSRPVYYPIIFFYQSNASTTSNQIQISLHLKHSLSHALPPFYPLAGRLPAHDNSLIHCNDAGVEFVHARAHARLADVVRAPAMDELKQLLPLDPTAAAAAAETADRALFLFQLTFFDCGGIAVGLCFSHQVADCVSAMALVGAWAETCRRPDQTRDFGISFDLHKYFPPRVSLVSRAPPILPGGKFVTKRFVFDKHKLTILKESASTSSINPTRVELVSGFIWRSFLKAGRTKDGGKNGKLRGAYHVVNLRSRFNPSGIFKNVMGNGIMFSFAAADCGGGDAEEGYDDLIGRLRRSIRKFDEDYIRQAQNGDDYVNYVENLRALDHEYCSFSSWTRFPMYEVDFGWGRPVWCCTTALPAKNLAVLMSSRGEEEIEAWVNMNEYHLEMLQAQFQLISPVES